MSMGLQGWIQLKHDFDSAAKGKMTRQGIEESIGRESRRYNKKLCVLFSSM